MNEQSKSKTCPFASSGAGSEPSRRIENLTKVSAQRAGGSRQNNGVHTLSRRSVRRDARPREGIRVVSTDRSVVSRSVFSVVVCAMLLALCISAYAQQQGKIYRIGYLGGGPGVEEREETFRRGLKELGYIEGQSIIIEWRFAKGDENVLPEMAADLVRLKPDVLVTAGTQPARALKDARTTIPIVVASAGDLVGRGLVTSLARPGGNITGSTSIAPDLNGKRLEILKAIVPRASRVAFFYQPHEQDELRELQVAARALGLHVRQHEVSRASEFESNYAEMSKERADALVISRNPFTNSHRNELVKLAAKHRLPAICDGTDWIEAGCLISYAQDRTEGSRRAAVFVDKILKGAQPADLPVEQPKRFDFVINLKTAKQIGLTIPPSVL
jgi:putative ABC transport system substrate-binding protein